MSVKPSAVQWFKTQISADDFALTLVDHSRVFGAFSTTNALWYHFPSLVVNWAGDMVTGFSGSSVSSYVGAYYCWRLASGVELNQPRLVQCNLDNGHTTDKLDSWPPND